MLTFYFTLCFSWTLTLSNTTNFRRFQIERVCRRKFQIWWNWQKVFRTGRKHCGKRRNCSLRAISPFPPVFSKKLVLQTPKNQGLFGKGLRKKATLKLQQLRNYFEMEGLLCLTLSLLLTTQKKKTFVDRINQDRTAQKRQSEPESPLSTNSFYIITKLFLDLAMEVSF